MEIFTFDERTLGWMSQCFDLGWECPRDDGRVGESVWV